MEGRVLFSVWVAVVASFCCSPARCEGWPCYRQGDDLCKCSTTNKTMTIDLRTILNDDMVRNINGREDVYVYSPCKPKMPPNTTITSTFHDNQEPALVWKVVTDTKWTAIGREQQITWTVNSTDPHNLQFKIIYYGGDIFHKNKHWKAEFLYKYSPNETKISYSGATDNKQQFEVVGRTVRAVGDNRRPTGGGSGVAVGVAGLFLIILCVVAVATYCVVGVAYNYRVKGERGSALVPNAGFWAELPVLIKDGVCFTISPCTSKYRSTQYQQL